MRTALVSGSNLDLIAARNISDPRAAAAFANLRQRQIILELVAKECSLSELASAAQMPLNLMHYHLSRLIALGLVKLTGRRTRAGAPVKLYRSVARTFFIPIELIGDPSTALRRRMQAALERGLTLACKGVTFSHDGQSAQVRVVLDSASSTDVAEFWFDLQLSRSEALSLAKDLRAVIEQYRSFSSRTRRSYIVHAALAPDFTNRVRASRRKT